MPLPHGWRVSKYDPALRDAGGRYLRTTWSAVSDLGRFYEGEGELDAGRYLATEVAYVAAVERFAHALGVATFRVRGLEQHEVDQSTLGVPPLTLPALAEGAQVEAITVGTVVRAALRELLWCKLESPRLHVHFGYDFSLYLSAEAACPEAVTAARATGLFVEPFVSPHGAAPGLPSAPPPR